MNVTLQAADLGSQIAALAIVNGEDERATAHAQRDAEEAAERAASAAEVQAMHDEASSIRVQAIVGCAISQTTAVAKAYCPAAGTACEGVQHLGDGVFQAAQHDFEATAAEQKAIRERAQDAAKDDDQAATDAGSSINSALEFDRGYASTVSQTQLAALHRA